MSNRRRYSFAARGPRSNPALTTLAAALLVAITASAASAGRIRVDPVVITGPATRAGTAAHVPWSGVWWPYADTALASGWNGTGADVVFDHTIGTCVRASAGKPVNDRSPLLKYDEYVRLATGTDPQSALLECAGDDDRDLAHSPFAPDAPPGGFPLADPGRSTHAAGWAAAAILEKEPVSPIEANGIRFEVADLKGLLSESYSGVESDFTGRRYTRPAPETAQGYDDARLLFAALQAGTPRPVAEYIEWCARVGCGSIDPTAPPSAYRGRMRRFIRNFEREFVHAYEDLEPHVFHRILESVIGTRRQALVFDIEVDEEVWNHPAFAYMTDIVERSDEDRRKRTWEVVTTVTYATDGVSESVIGVAEFSAIYTYTLVTRPNGKVVGGTWTGSSVDNHPDFAWLPTFNPTKVDYGENHHLLYGTLLALLPRDHAAGTPALLEVRANGDAGAPERSWTRPVVVAGELVLTAAVAPGEDVSLVRYFEQDLGPAGAPGACEALPGTVAVLGDGQGADASLTIPMPQPGLRLIAAHVYDNGGRLLAIDDVTVDVGVPAPAN